MSIRKQHGYPRSGLWELMDENERLLNKLAQLSLEFDLKQKHIDEMKAVIERVSKAEQASRERAMNAERLLVHNEARQAAYNKFQRQHRCPDITDLKAKRSNDQQRIHKLKQDNANLWKVLEQKNQTIASLLENTCHNKLSAGQLQPWMFLPEGKEMKEIIASMGKEVERLGKELRNLKGNKDV